jgi:arylsulfatase
MLTTLVAAAGDTTAKEELKKGRRIGDRTYKVHLDGYDLGPALRGEACIQRQHLRCAVLQLRAGGGQAKIHWP